MSSGSDQLQVGIALAGADEFGSAIDSVDEKLKSLQTDAQTASGDTGIGGLGTAAGSANTPVSNLSTSAGNLATKVSALTAGVSGTIGGIVNLKSSYDGLVSQQTSAERSTTMVKTAIEAHELAVEALNKYVKENTGNLGDNQKAVDALAKANEKVSKDEQAIADDVRKLNDLRAKGKTNTEEYQKALEKLSNDQQKLTQDQGDAKTKQEALTTAAQKHINTLDPKYIELQQRVQSTQERVTEAQQRAKEQQDRLTDSYIKFGLSIGQTVLGAISSVAGAIATFGKNASGAKSGVDELGGSVGGLSTKMGAIGLILTAVAVGIALIGTNAFGVRDKLEQWWTSISKGNPLLEAFGHLIHGIAADLGLTGTGFMSGNDEITKAINSIHNALQQTNIGKDLDDLIKKFQAFLQDPFGSTSSTAYTLTNKPDTFFAPGIGKNITSLGPNAMLTQTQTSNAAALGQAILKTIEDGIQWVIKNVPKGIEALGTWLVGKINDALKTGGSLDQLGAAIVNGIGNYFQGKQAADSIRNDFWTLVWNVVTGGDVGQAAQQFFGKIGLAALKAIFNFPKSQTGQAIGGQASEIIQNIANFLFNPKQWANLGTTVVAPALLAAFGGIKWTGDEITKIFTPLFDTKNWSGLGSKAIDALAFVLGGGSVTAGQQNIANIGASVEKIFGPLFDTKNWSKLSSKAVDALAFVLGGGNAAAGQQTLANIGADVEKIFGPLFDTKNWSKLSTKAVQALAFVLGGGDVSAGQQAINNIGADVEKIFGPLFDTKNWSKLSSKAISALESVFGVGTNGQGGIDTGVVGKIFTPLFTTTNWTQFGSKAIAALESLFAAGGAAAGGITKAVVGTIFTPLFDTTNWTQFADKARAALTSFTWITLDTFEKIFAPLWDTSNWAKVGGLILHAIAGALGPLGGLFHQSAYTVPGTTSGGGFANYSRPGLYDPGGALYNSQQYGYSPSLGPNPYAVFAATLNPNPTINTAARQPIVVNLNVSGQRLAQVMAPFNTGTSGFA